jgi:hypothetical protein
VKKNLLLFCLSLKLKSLEGTARFCESIFLSDLSTTVASMSLIVLQVLKENTAETLVF